MHEEFDIIAETHKKEMRIYLDNCCYNRPFDEQAQLRVRLETVTKLAVQLLMATRAVEYAWSGVLDYEISFNPFPKRQTSIMWWKEGAAVYVETTDEIIRRGEEIEQLGVKPKDALHLASAEKANCDMFLTTDRGILKKVPVLGRMKVVNPIQFISEEYNANL
ncbi:MAG: type II toxin-antitoxin system VapC family toxin [Lentisphaerae bacterium]|nr:type II toxin-antitoxin system VapC family toxin [Lentisphaerota bacterium]